MNGDPASAQWLAYFAAGGRHDIPYNPRATIDSGHVGDAIFGGIGALSGTMVPSGPRSNRPSQFYGDTPSPAFGFSQHGIHLPVVPLVKWDDIAAVIVKNLRGTLRRAHNGQMLADPGVGSAGSERAELVLVLKNAPLIASTITGVKSVGLVTGATTAAGQQWGTIAPQLEPDLGPEQTVQLAYLLQMMTAQRGIRTFQVGGAPGAVGSLVKQLYALN